MTAHSSKYIGQISSGKAHSSAVKGYDKNQSRLALSSTDQVSFPVASNSELDTGSLTKRAPEIARSAIFGALFMAAIFVTLFAVILSFSNESRRIARAMLALELNLFLIGFLALFLGARVWKTLFAKVSRRTAPLLHRRFVFIFSLAALLPAVIVGAFSLYFISQDIDDIFGDGVRDNLTQARSILDDYVDQEWSELGKDLSLLTARLNMNPSDIQSRISLTAALQIQARVHDLDAIYIMSENGDVLSRVESPGAPPLIVPSQSVLNNIDQGQVAYKKRDDQDFLIALAQLPGFSNVYLYAGRSLRSDSQVLSSISGIEGATSSLSNFNNQQAQMRRIFVFTLFETAILIMMAAIWLGLLLGNRIIDPLSRLVVAAERVRAGDMSARVDVSHDWGEISDLGGAFNRMTQQLDTQRDALIKEHDISEQRRQFSEAVLSGVRAGVIGLTQTGRITLVNKSAELLLGLKSDELVDTPIDRVLPEFAQAFEKGRENIKGTSEDQVNFEINGEIRNFDLRVSAYEGARRDTGWVMTFDDMTRLVSAQRHSAWREVARRIAHEIKNPLTPIQLSAERLERKYKKEIISDPQIFENCTQTIIRQVGSLEQMVNEFSAFARMPAPEFEEVELQSLVDSVLFEQGVAFPEVEFSQDEHLAESEKIWGDERLITQALTNVFKNAAEAVSRLNTSDEMKKWQGKVSVSLSSNLDSVTISTLDNGPGWPLSDKLRLLEPYVTTRETGTGLGLAIVKRITEDHGGTLVLYDRDDGVRGARVEMTLLKAPNLKSMEREESLSSGSENL